MKREHNLSSIHKKEILAATEECLLSAIALDLKRMVKAIFSVMYIDEIWAGKGIFPSRFYICQQIQPLTLTPKKLVIFFFTIFEKISIIYKNRLSYLPSFESTSTVRKDSVHIKNLLHRKAVFKNPYRRRTYGSYNAQ